MKPPIIQIRHKEDRGGATEISSHLDARITMAIAGSSFAVLHVRVKGLDITYKERRAAPWQKDAVHRRRSMDVVFGSESRLHAKIMA